MAELSQEITYEQPSGLNWDDDFRFMGKGDSEYRLNIAVNSFGNTYVITNMLGNTQHEHTFTHGSAYGNATYTCIGSCYDVERDASYLFISSDHGNDSIIRFNFDDNSFDKIVWDHTGIDLDSDYPITDAFMIGDWLHFNPRSTSPRVINVDWAYYDHVVYRVKAGTNHAVGDYVVWYNKVYRADSVVDRGTVPTIEPEHFTYIGFCYQDVYQKNASSNVGEYFRIRDFYNTSTLLPYTPDAAVGTDSSYEYNNIRGRRFQFCFRHYVPEQGYTVSSPFTDIIAAPSSETNKGEVVGDIGQYNKIDITFPVATKSSIDSGEYDYLTLFEFVEVLFREGPDDKWKIAERIDHQTIATSLSGDQYSIDFYNDRSYEIADSAFIEKQYNPLPILANAQWSLSGERSAYGGVIVGRDNINTLSVSLTVGERELSYTDVGGAVADSYAFSGEYDTAMHRWKYTTTTNIDQSSAPAAEGDVLKITASGVEYTKVLSATDDDNDNNYADAIVDLINQTGVPALRESGPVVSYWVRTSSEVIENVYLYQSTVSETAAYKAGSFKNGAWHPFCIYYYDDALRRSEPMFDETMRVYVDTLPEALTASNSTNYQRYIDWAVTHEAPSWASYWGWGYAGNQTIDKFWQYNIYSITEETKPVGSDTWTKIDISPLQRMDDEDAPSDFDHYFPNTAIEAYAWEPGDRVRFITDKIDPPSGYDGLSLMADNFDYEIKDFDEVNHYIYIDELESPATSTTTMTTASGDDDWTQIIEIYRPKKQTGTTVYYEYGPLYPVVASGNHYYHKGDSQDQSGTGADEGAEGQFTNGDVFVITRLFSVSPFTTVDNPAFVESYSWSDFNQTEGWGKGKAGAFTGIGQKYLNNIVYSNKFQPDSNLGGLSTFDFLDKISLSTEHGDIVAMRQVGDALKVYFERNTAAVLVNKTEYFDASGQSQVVTSDRALGSVRYSNYHYGTIFPESVLLRDRTVYFYDIYRDTFLRDSANGLEPISDYKMRRYFDEKSLALRSSGVSNIQVWTAYDYEYDMVYVHFIDSVDSSNDEVILFHEPQNRWVTFLQIADTVTELITTTTSTSSTSTSSTSTSTSSSTHGYDTGLIFGRGSMKLVSFIGEDVYTHNDNTTRNNFWGDQRSSIIHVVANEAANVKKTYEALAIHSNKPWDVEDIKVAVDPTYEYGMVSKVPESRFVLREGIYRSDYLRNMRTNQATSATLDLVRGEHLRGYYIIHRLVNDDTDEVRLFKVDVLSNVSRI